MTSCYRCGIELAGNSFGRKDTCPGCGADVRCCRNCVFEEPSYRSECRETQAEPVRDRDSANYCDYFRPRQGPPAPRPTQPHDTSRATFNALFRKPPTA
jgi:hypothetical protein